MTEKLRQSLRELSSDVRAVDLHDRVLAGSRRITLRNRALGTALVAAAVLTTIIGVQVLRPVADPMPPAESPSPIPTPSPNSSPNSEPSNSPSTPVTLPALYDATIEVPAFPNTPCKAGSRKFTGGVARVDDYTNLKIGRAIAPVVSDVDGVPGDETLVEIACQMDTSARKQLIALKVQAGTVTTVGFVFRDFGMELDAAEGIQVTGGTIYVEVFSGCDQMCPNSEKQRRGFAYRNGRFEQVSGPTTFTPIPAVAQLDPRNTTLGFGFESTSGHLSGHVRVVNGRGEARFALGNHTEPLRSAKVSVTVGSFTRGKRNGMDFIAAILTVTDESGVARQIAYAFIKEQSYPGPMGGTLLVASGTEGVTGIKAISAGTDVVTITVATSSGDKSWTYRPGPANEYEWRRA